MATDFQKIIDETMHFMRPFAQQNPRDAARVYDLLFSGVAPQEIPELRGFVESAPAVSFDAPIDPVSSLESTAIDLIESTEPLREELIGRSQDFLSGDFDVTETPAFANARSAAGRQFNAARDSILENLPQGGVLLDRLADLPIARAQDLELAEAGLFEQEMNRALSLATGAPFQAGLGILGTQSAQQTQLQAAQQMAEANRDAAAKGSLGTGAGAFFGAK